MKSKDDEVTKREETSENNPFDLFITERIEDYIALTLALTIVILVLVFD
ncbi:hypothetical protein V6C27_01190 [Peptococcaceae bacterium 1198_IL3148]